MSAPAVIDDLVSLRAGATLYERFGDAPGLALALLILLLGWAVALRPSLFRSRPRARHRRT